MGYEFRQAVRESVGLLIGLIGPSGAGKTFSAMRIAAGIVGKGNRFAVIDTENRRALHYASAFKFDHLELSPPFSSLKFAEAIEAADKAGYKATVVDSCSHEWASEGGVLDFQEAELARMAGDDWKKREACKMAAWIRPKGDHKKMVQRLLRSRAHLLLCFRAEEKTKIEKDSQGKTHIIPMGFQPICSKELPYELTVSFLLEPDHPGIGKPIKLQEQHKVIFPNGKLLDESAGAAAAEWAKGGVKAPPAAPTPPDTPKTYPQQAKIEALIAGSQIDRESFKEYLYSIGWLELKNEKPSLSTISEVHAQGIVDKWAASVVPKFEGWKAKQGQ